MSRLISRAEGFERVYQAFDTINFTAFDYTSVKQSLLDYIKLTFPESFNDFIESSELIVIIETFAYVAELLAYRIDIAAHENFISTAQRKDSILRLAKLISYTASRPIAARGLVKFSSISTTEPLSSATGTQLSNKTIRWNDPSNAAWKEQFLLVMNRVLDQDIGNISPSDRFQIQDVLFELYSFNNNPIKNGVFSYSANSNGRSVPMELVPVQYDVDQGILERRPINNANFTVLYGTDGLGDGSNTTGFFCYTKQGTLQKFNTTFDGITPSQLFNIPTINVNDTDVWVNQINPDTGQLVDKETGTVVRERGDIGISGEWDQVDIAHAQNITFNTNPKRNKYEIETRDNNQIRLIFGDGEFANIPGGTFDIWVRSSVDEDIVVAQGSVVDTPISFTYTDNLNQIQTCTFTVSLIGSLQNASASETLEHIRSTAPAVYYTQDRMVNAQDYNVFLLQDPSILKLRAVNRTFAGDSKYITFHDSSNTYENVKIFGNDGYLYFEDLSVVQSTDEISLSDLIDAYVEPILASTDLFVRLVSEGVNPSKIHRLFTPNEKLSITKALLAAGSPSSASLYFRKTDSTWFAIEGLNDGSTPGSNPAIDLAYNALNPAGSLATNFWVPGPTNPFISTPLIIIKQPNSNSLKYNVSRTARRVTFESPTTLFWNTNDGNKVVNYDSLRSEFDQIVIMQANINHNRTTLLKQNWNYNILGQSTINVGPSAGLSSDNKVIVLPVDENQDRIPDNLSVAYPASDGLGDIINPTITVVVPPNSTIQVTTPILYTPNYGDISIVLVVGDLASITLTESSQPVANIVTLENFSINPATVTLVMTDYVYFTRASISEEFTTAPTTTNSVQSYLINISTTQPEFALWTRRVGRSGLNFMWTHTTPRYYLVDPSPTNINDMFIITKGYFTDLRRWIQDPAVSKPVPPTPLDLRTSYGQLLQNKMVSDTVILHPGRIKLLFGDKSHPSLRAKFKIVRSESTSLTDNQVKATAVATIRNFFDILQWEFGQTFYVTELLTAIHNALRSEINSVVIVPTEASSQFGDLFQVVCQEDEIFYSDINVEDIEVVTTYTPINLRLNN